LEDVVRVDEALEDFGLTSNEIKLYLASLKLGVSRIQDVARQAGILRTTAYEVVKSLVAKGVVGTVIKSGILFVEAVDPSRFENLLDEKRAKIQVVLPFLNHLKKSVIEKPQVEFYEGKEGLKTILEDILRTRTQYCVIANYAIFKVLDFYFPNFVRRRVKQKVFARVIQERTPELVQAKKRDKEELREMRFSPVVFSSNVFIYANNAAFLTVSRDEPVGVLIRNKEISDTLRQFFELIWKSSSD
jgi:HTH-type transcriptional regulator, sugar sensing transcriptional regulator